MSNSAVCFDSSIWGCSLQGWRLLSLQVQGFGFPRHTARRGLSITPVQAGLSARFAAKVDDIGGPSQPYWRLDSAGKAVRFQHGRSLVSSPPLNLPLLQPPRLRGLCGDFFLGVVLFSGCAWNFSVCYWERAKGDPDSVGVTSLAGFVLICVLSARRVLLGLLGCVLVTGTCIVCFVCIDACPLIGEKKCAEGEKNCWTL